MTDAAGSGDRSGLARLEATVRGRVQGVGFRYFILREAAALGLHGWVANAVDGSVESVAEGPRHDLEAFLERLETGPPAAHVDRVNATWSQARGGLDGFSVRSGSHRGD